MSKTYFWIILLSFSSLTLSAQNRISGQITDTKTAPLALANVILHGQHGTVTGTISDDHGEFSFENLQIGEYRLEISMIGFQTVNGKLFELSSQNANYIENFTLEEETQLLGDVMVEAKRPKIRQTSEKLILDIENSPSVSSNLQEIIKKVPGVILMNGNLSYAGQQGITILINGKTTEYMDVETLLRNMPADNIAKIELIQQPGAEFPAEGTGPVINIILKKNVSLGTTGTARASVGYDAGMEYGTSAMISSYKNKVNWTLGVGYNQISYEESLEVSRQVDANIYHQATVSPFDPATLRFNAGLDYHLNENNRIGVSGRRTQTQSDRLTHNTTAIESNTAYEPLDTQSSFDRSQTVLDLNPYYTFENENTRLNLDFNYVDYENDNVNQLYQLGPSPIAFEDRRYLQDSDYQIMIYKADFRHSFDPLTLSTGVRYSAVESASNLKSFEKNDAEEYEHLEDQSDLYMVDETILALYAKVSAKLKLWDVSAGLRWEESQTDGISRSTGETNARDISRLFPSASIGRQITDQIGSSISYSYRISRPSYSSLNSFVYYYDPYTAERGNPKLQPSFTHNLQFNLTFDQQPFFSVGYSDTEDALFQILTQNDQTAQAARSTINLANYKNWNFRLFAPLNFLSRMNGYTGVIVNHAAYESQNLTPALDLSKWSLTWFTNVEYELPWDIRSELSGFYLSGGLQGQIEHDSMVGMGFSLSKDFFDEKFRVNFSIQELLNRKFHGHVRYDNVDAQITSDWSRQNVSLEVVYNFGSNFSKNRSRNTSSREEQDRIESNN